MSCLSARTCINGVFNTMRLPRIGSDEMLKFPGNDYMIVLRYGHMFKVILKNGQKDVQFAQLKEIFQAILNKEQDVRWAGCSDNG